MPLGIEIKKRTVFECNPAMPCHTHHGLTQAHTRFPTQLKVLNWCEYGSAGVSNATIDLDLTGPVEIRGKDIIQVTDPGEDDTTWISAYRHVSALLSPYGHIGTGMFGGDRYLATELWNGTDFSETRIVVINDKGLIHPLLEVREANSLYISPSPIDEVGHPIQLGSKGDFLFSAKTCKGERTVLRASVGEDGKVQAICQYETGTLPLRPLRVITASVGDRQQHVLFLQELESPRPHRLYWGNIHPQTGALTGDVRSLVLNPGSIGSLYLTDIFTAREENSPNNTLYAYGVDRGQAEIVGFRWFLTG